VLPDGDSAIVADFVDAEMKAGDRLADWLVRCGIAIVKVSVAVFA
jgi:hypothetical protein